MRRRAEKRKEIELIGGKLDAIDLLQVFFSFSNPKPSWHICKLIQTILEIAI
jgi:hypothetical protein